MDTLRISVEQFSEFQVTLYLAFIDFGKAFDSPNQDKIWESLKSFGSPWQKILTLSKLSIGTSPAKWFTAASYQDL